MRVYAADMPHAPKGAEGPKAEPSLWDDPEVAARFAARPPDQRLLALFAGEGPYGAVRRAWGAPARPKALDVGCAGGRNAVWLARQGADVWALDASSTMVAEARRGLNAVMGQDEAARRVRRGRMHDLGRYRSGAFDLVVALGVLQDATSRTELGAAMMEVARVLRPGGLCLVANFGPESRPDGAALLQLAGEPDVWLGFGPGSRRMTLPDLAGLDAAFAVHGLYPALPTTAVRVATPGGFRVTFNALYVKGR